MMHRLPRRSGAHYWIIGNEKTLILASRSALRRRPPVANGLGIETRLRQQGR
jgi:hypothetical protein